jgi:hypothetical protein
MTKNNNYANMDDKHYYMYLSLDYESREEIDAIIEDHWNRQYADALREEIDED